MKQLVLFYKNGCYTEYSRNLSSFCAVPYFKLPFETWYYLIIISLFPAQWMIMGIGWDSGHIPARSEEIVSLFRAQRSSVCFCRLIMILFQIVICSIYPEIIIFCVISTDWELFAMLIIDHHKVAFWFLRCFIKYFTNCEVQNYVHGKLLLHFLNF